MTQAPRRLLDDPEVSAHLRDDLRQAAADPGPDFDLDDAVARFEADPRDVRADSGRRRRWTVRVVAGSIVLGGTTLAAAAIGYGVLFGGADESAPPTPAASAATAEPAAEPAPTPAPAVEVSDSIPDEPTEGEPTAAPQRRPSTAAEKRSARDELLRREVAHLAQVRSAVGSSPSRAVRLANEGHSEFAGGALYVEREALAISALSRLGRRSEARARGQRLLAAYPRHPFAEQVRRQTGAK